MRLSMRLFMMPMPTLLMLFWTSTNIASTEALMSTSRISQSSSSIINNILAHTNANANANAKNRTAFTLSMPMTKEPNASNLRGGSILSKFKVTSVIIKEQFALRLAADPNFVSKSITEVILAAITQFIAECSRRGRTNMITEIDFVIAGIFTAIAGKYYSMWKVAPTSTSTSASRSSNSSVSSKGHGNDHSSSSTVSSSSSSKIPTNAFQTDEPYSLMQRSMAFILPIPDLFRAGFIASAIGYGLTQILISLRSLLVPSYEAATASVNIIHACLYTGGFMAVVSNIRYQLLQGIIEPMVVEKIFRNFPFVKAAAIFAVRLANGLLGSSLAIAGMKMFGLQKLK
eukprot:scaffold4640_cov283-Chaetoceros_neogracile.AAC.3